MADLIIIDKDELALLAKDGGKLLYEPQAEEAILKLLDLRDYLDEIIEYAADRITEKGKELDSNFSGVAGDKLKSIYRPYGSKYKIKKHLRKSKFIERTIKYTPITETIEEHLKKTGELPSCISENEQTYRLTFQRKKD